MYTKAQIKYMEQHSLSEPPKCPVCGGFCFWIYNKKYSLFCSEECKNSEQGKIIINQNRQEAFKQKYGVDNPNKLQSSKDKRKETCMEKYGTEHYSQTDEYKEKTKDSNNKKFGCDWASQNNNIKKKVKDTFNDIYGAWPTSLPKIKNKAQETHRINYYGTLIEKLKQRSIVPLFTYEFYLNNIENLLSYKYRCEKCGSEFETFKTNPQTICCNVCSITQPEHEIRQWLESMQIEATYNKRFELDGKKYELDLYIPQFKLGIEFNGIYWHSEQYLDKNYHQNKYKHFKQMEIDVIQIFENEWLNNKCIVLSIIKNKLKLNETIYARKCVAKEISSEDYMHFCELNHLQGGCNAKVKIGLIYNNEIVQVISLSKPRFNKNYQWELIRSCTKLNCNVVGGFNKLFSYFKQIYEPTNIITYCDVRYFNGHGYQQAGFNLVDLTSPDFFYSECKIKNNLKMYHRTHFQKHKLKNILKKYDETLTTEQNILNNGYIRIFDAGNLKFVWTKKKEQ